MPRESLTERTIRLVLERNVERFQEDRRLFGLPPVPRPTADQFKEKIREELDALY